MEDRQNSMGTSNTAGRWRPLMLTGSFLLAAMLCVFVLTDWPRIFSSERYTQKKISAIAIRDNVSNLEKRGSALFTIPYLQKNYFKYNYLEAKHDWISAREFCPYAEELLKNSDSLDVYILSHGNVFYEWFYQMDTSLLKRIRLVYNTGCNNDSQYVCYKGFQVSHYVGHTGENSISPLFYFYFLRRMCGRESICASVESSNEPAQKILSLIFSHKDSIAASLGNYHDLRK